VLRHISERYVRGFGAAIIAVGALLLAANAVPAKAADSAPVHQVGQAGQLQQAGHAGP
jgi:hypothetical protein